MITVGMSLPPDRATLALVAPALERCAHLEVAPETLWAPSGGFNTFFGVARGLRDRLGVPLVAHGVGLCTSTSHPADADRQRRWLDRLAETHRALDFAWMTDHSGATSLAGEDQVLPVAVPLTTRSRDVLRARLADLRAICGVGGVENSALYALLDPPEAEPGFLAAALGDEHALLLDLHNLVVLEENHGLRAEAWLDRAPLDRVIELHVAGGRGSEGLPVRRRFRLDSHDDRVPDRVWALLDAVLPRLPALRAITLERLEGTVGEEDVPGLVEDLERARDAAGRWRPCVAVPAARAELPSASDEDHEAVDAVFAEVHRAADPRATLAARLDAIPSVLRLAAERALGEPDALRLTGLLVAQQRFSRLLRGSADLEAAFDADPASFTAAFRAWHRATPPTHDPLAEVASFRAFGPEP